jgi:Protein of unknown function DUF262
VAQALSSPKIAGSKPMTETKKGQIESAKVVVLTVFQDFWFCIPDYQRSYVWGKDEISELIDDVKYASEHSPTSQYFLGSMVLHRDTGTPSFQEQDLNFTVHNVLDGREWAKFWEATENEFEADEFDRFLSFVRTIYVKDKAREGLLKEFDERVYKPGLLQLGTSTFQAVQIYKTAYDEAVLLNPSPRGSGNQDYQNLIIVMRRAIPSKDWIPPVLAWYKKFKTVDLLTFLRRLNNKFSADWIYQLTPTLRIKNMNDVLTAIDKAEKTRQCVGRGWHFRL